MNVYHFTPYSVEKNLGKEYNRCFEMIGEDDWACLRDGDTMFLTPDWGDIIFNYAYENPGCVLVCWTNRIHELAKEQRQNFKSDDILFNLRLADETRTDLYETTDCIGNLSGFLMLIPKLVWNRVKFKDGILGVDTQFFKDIREVGIPIKRMDGLYIWHTYRLGKDIKDTTHLK